MLWIDLQDTQSNKRSMHLNIKYNKVFFFFLLKKKKITALTGFPKSN